MQKTLMIFLILAAFCSGCVNDTNQKVETDWSKPEQFLENGQLLALSTWVDSAQHAVPMYSELWMKLDSFRQIANRVQLEFSLDEGAVREQLNARIDDDYTQEELEGWEHNGKLEYKVINGEKRYFKRAASNLALLLNKGDGLIDAALDSFCLVHTNEVIRAIDTANTFLAEPQVFEVQFDVRLQADVVPAGEMVRCWLPFPKTSHGRQRDVELVSVYEPSYLLADDSCVHGSIYMEKPAIAGKETVFSVAYNFQSYAEYYDMGKLQVLPYDTSTTLYKQYTAQQAPHIVFSKEMMQLSDSICGNEVRPHEVVKRLYYWIDENIPWAGALEYAIMPDIPRYVLNNRKGDCGMQTLLFMAMVRYKGIPVKWQSGWMLHPDAINLHDWCEVYYQGVGWVPLDMSFSLQKSDDERIKEFYISGIDAYRLIINDDIGADFHPIKRFMRSEPWDFQRGELEWSGGNIYFNQWTYELTLL
ncbi:transglutaminase domain-containing protein [Carboxylicivirga mesophila]|uniref:Transglutaminase domain-containing protein n=1 Tax=Carboxylicivirga mesophila TaxID=1166478 RepID=A0ABS5KBQ8_9BACT|nr:transglutaminase-like domain-containing protein [Carboxylicivirga mesophila]MBS2211928.1 transglutaminase domain-containing protein [Carboxylicivirga mesophila]